jgi:hypothetical protein
MEFHGCTTGVVIIVRGTVTVLCLASCMPGTKGMSGPATVPAAGSGKLLGEDSLSGP